MVLIKNRKEHRKMGKTTQCKNNYTEETFMESFGKDENDIKKCNNCPNFNYDCGLVTCSLFQK